MLSLVSQFWGNDLNMLGFIKPKICFGRFPVWEIPTEITNLNITQNLPFLTQFGNRKKFSVTYIYVASKIKRSLFEKCHESKYHKQTLFKLINKL